MTIVAIAKYCDRSSRVSSASRPSDNVVNPTRSPNMMVVRRRSATRFGASDEAGSDVGAAVPVSAAPQSPQNFLPGSRAAPHAEQMAASGPPQSLQNFLPSGFSAAQEGHEIATCSTPPF